jgi:glycosyltransferase involved in cell wall biosynthesis
VKRSRPCVLIYNPVSGHGHLDSWNALFVGLLLERGYRILALTPDRKALESRLAQRNLAEHPMLHVLDWNAPRDQPKKPPNLSRLWHWWLSYGKSYAEQYPESRIVPGMQTRIRIKKRMFQIIVPPLYKLSYICHSLLFWQIATKNDGPEDPSERHYFEPVDMAYRINAALKESRWAPDCLFNMYLDPFKTSAEAWRQFATICRLPWGGIRFAPLNAPPREGYYALPSLRGICFLDEAICRAYSASLSDKRFQYLPDITNVELSEHPSFLTEEIMYRAAGRKIIFLGGSIVGKKNIARWSELIALADPSRWFFVQVGEIHGNTFSSADTAAFERLVTRPPENLLLHAHYLPDEKEFNDIIRIADIIFAVYRDFRFSSNMLSKAAYFKKPILVSDGCLMADRVRHHGIGFVIPHDDVQAMLRALDQLVAEPIPMKQFGTYCADFSERVAADHLENFLSHLLV